MANSGKQRFVQAFIAQLAVEAFDKPILLRLARCDVMPTDHAILRPRQHRHTRQVRAIVADHRGRVAAGGGNCIEFTCHALARQRGVGDQR